MFYILTTMELLATLTTTNSHKKRVRLYTPACCFATLKYLHQANHVMILTIQACEIFSPVVSVNIIILLCLPVGFRKEHVCDLNEGSYKMTFILDEGIAFI